jgi:hypothetical protein
MIPSTKRLDQSEKYIIKSDVKIVPDRRCRILPEVFSVGRWVAGVLGIWRGEGLG